MSRGYVVDWIADLWIPVGSHHEWYNWNTRRVHSGYVVEGDGISGHVVEADSYEEAAARWSEIENVEMGYPG